jgi:hypothetical protein
VIGKKETARVVGAARVKYWEIIVDNLSDAAKAGSSWGDIRRKLMRVVACFSRQTLIATIENGS